MWVSHLVRNVRRCSSDVGPKGGEVTGGWRKFGKEDYHNLRTSAYVIKAIKLWTVRYAGHVACKVKIQLSLYWPTQALGAAGG